MRQSRSELKDKWITGYIPTQEDFADLFESNINIQSDIVSGGSEGITVVTTVNGKFGDIILTSNDVSASSLIHSHEVSAINGLEQAINDVTINKADLIHTHEISGVNGLQAELDRIHQVDLFHTHSISGIVGLESELIIINEALSGKAETFHTHEVSAVNGLENFVNQAVTGMVYTNSTPISTTLGGIEIGTTFDQKTMSEMFDALLYPYKYPVFSFFFITDVSNLEVGNFIPSGNKTFSWGYTNQSNIINNSISITDTTSSTTLATNLTVSDTSTVINTPMIVNDTATTNVWTISGRNTKNAVFSRTLTISWRWAVYYGESVSGSLNGTNIKSLRVKELLTSSAKTYSLNTTGYKYICYPTAFGLKTIFKDTSTNLEVAMNPYYIESITNDFGVTTNYYVHRTLNILGGSINIIVS